MDSCYHGYYVVVDEKDFVYSETPEERGQGSGPNLVRIFFYLADAVRYREALQAYNNRPLTVQETSISGVRKNIRDSGRNCQLVSSRMEDGEWPKEISLPESGSFLVH